MFFEDESEEIRPWQWIVTVIVIVILIVLGYFLFKDGGHPKKEPILSDKEYCETYYAWYKFNQLPAKCIKYFLTPEELKIYKSGDHVQRYGWVVHD